MIVHTACLSRRPRVVYALEFAGTLLPSFAPQLALVFPWQFADLAAGFALRTPLPAAWPMPVLATAGWTLLFVAAALWRFAREEF